MAYIYVITNDVNNKQYVGKTSDTIEQRFKIHLKDSQNRKNELRPLYQAMNKYGTEHFYIEKLEECSAKEASEREVFWIEKLDTYKNGYNATRGGDGKVLYDYAAIAKEYASTKDVKNTCDKIGCDPATLRKACRESGVEIISSQEISKQRYSKQVYQCDKKTHKELKCFNSLMEAATYMVENNLTNCKHSTIRTHISEVCRGKRKSAAGFYWHF